MPCSHVSRQATMVASLTAVLALVAADALAADFREEVTRPFDRTVTISGTPTLRVEHRNGDVRIRAHARNEVRIKATIRVSANSRSDAAAFADRIQIDVQQSPVVVTVTTQYPSSYRGENRDLSYAVDYDLLVPDRVPLDLRNRFGNVSVIGMKADGLISNRNGRVSVTDGSGRYQLENAFGSIDAARLVGDLTIRGANGAVSATGITGAVTVTNRFGIVTATTIRGDAIVANSNGNVDAGGITGKADLRTTFGFVNFRDVGGVSVSSQNGSVTGAIVGGSATISATFGAVTLRNVARDARVVNANGSIALQDVRGGADLSTRFGRIEAQAVKGGLRVSSANGAIKVTDIDGAVYLKTSFGLVQAERVRGALTVDNSNGGVQASAIGGPATVSSSFGAIVVRDVNGRVDVRNKNGSVEAWPAVRAGTCHDVALATSFAGMEVHLPDAGYALNARTTFGRIEAEVPITATGTIRGSAISGTIGRGGCALQLTNANGGIRILRALAGPR
jgi:DUF4097 and DUF4098 domain-containing protein YvlB